LLRADNVTFGYGDTTVVRNVSLDVADDGFVGIIGPNGSGKTTLLRLLAGTRVPLSGDVTLDGTSMRTVPRTRIARRVAVVPQETHLAFEYSVLEVVLMGRYPHLGAFAIEGPDDIDVAREALAATGTLDLQARPFSTLSGGEKQRVIIAAALAQISPGRLGAGGSACPPKRKARGWGLTAAGAVLLLDEPTAALDLKYQLGVASLLRSLHTSGRLAIVVSTHDLNFAASLCRSVVMLKKGQVLAAGDVNDVLTPERIRGLYDVDAEVRRHPVTGHLTITPLRAVHPGSVPGSPP
jgi:iron complex transport system ATP-binding protein